MDQDIPRLFPNFDQYNPWVKKLLTVGLYSPGGGKQGANKAWMDTKIFLFKEAQGRLVGSLSREEVQKFRGTLSEQGRIQLDTRQDIRQDIRQKCEDDLWAVKWAGISLDRLIENEEDERWRQGSEPFPTPPAAPAMAEPTPQPEPEPVVEAPPPPAPEPKEQEELPLENDRGPEGATVTMEDQDASEESSTEVVEIKADLMDPTYITSEMRGLMVLDAARQKLFETDDVEQAAKIGDLGKMIEALAASARLGQELEYEGKALHFSALYRVGKLLGQQPTGRPRLEEKRPKQIFNDSTLRLISTLMKHEETDFQWLLEEGIQKRTLSEATFKLDKPNKSRGIPHDHDKSPKSREKKAKSTKSPNGQQTMSALDPLNPMRHIILFLADYKANMSWYVPHVMAQHPLVVENLAAVVDQLERFVVDLCAEIRSQITEETK